MRGRQSTKAAPGKQELLSLRAEDDIRPLRIARNRKISKTMDAHPEDRLGRFGRNNDRRIADEKSEGENAKGRVDIVLAGGWDENMAYGSKNAKKRKEETGLGLTDRKKRKAYTNWKMVGAKSRNHNTKWKGGGMTKFGESESGRGSHLGSFRRISQRSKRLTPHF